MATVRGAWLLADMSSFAPVATYSIAGLDAEMTPVKLVVGVLLIVFALIEWFSLATRLNVDSRYLPFGGLFSGFFGGLSGHQGAFRSTFLLHAGLNTKGFVACNAAIAAIVDITRLAVYGLNLPVLLADVDMSLLVAATHAAFLGVMADRPRAKASGGHAADSGSFAGGGRALTEPLRGILGKCILGFENVDIRRRPWTAVEQYGLSG